MRVLEPAPAASGPAEPRPLLAGFVDDFDPRFSPDGRLIAFTSNESGKSEVYVCAYHPDGTVSDPVRVSSGGGGSPAWTAGGKTLLYVADPGRLMSASISAEPMLTSGPPVQTLDLERLMFGDFTVLGDGRLFGVLRSELETSEVRGGNVVLDFFEELKRKIARAK